MGEITLRQALEEYRTIYLASRNFAERTRVEYINDLQDLINFLEQSGLKEVKNVGLPQLERFLAELDRRGLAGSTRKRKVVSIRSFLWYLYQDGYISVNLSKRLIPPFSEANNLRYLSKSEFERLLKASSENPRDFALVQLLLQTGIKLSELTQLTVQDVELPADIYPEMKNVGYLHILGSKTKKGRVIPLNSKVCVSLANYFNRRKIVSNQALFINRDGETLSPRGVEKIVQKYMLQASIVNASVQSLRHTFGVHHIIGGATLKMIKEVMGYRDLRAVTIYRIIVKYEFSKQIQEHAL
ncbi:MAG: tyrosine-type recombinase/integrase [Anaerolineales bacterium]|nr:tyrosine-type recombinase/integrase [Anaerolineales bacterium]